MRARLVLVACVALLFAFDPITASADSLTSSANPSTVGQEVTFTATYSVSCADGVAVHFFTVDGADAGYTTHSGSGQVFTTTLTTSSLSAGDHAIVFTWSTSTPPAGPSCGSMLPLTQTVNNPPPPAEAPSPSPPPSEATPPPSTSPSPTSVGATSAVRLTSAPARAPSIPIGLLALAGGVIAGGAVVIFVRLRAR